MNEDIFSRLIFQNCSLKKFQLVNDEFSHCLKQAEVIPVSKKEGKLDKSNYRPESILPVISKMYERLMYDQMYKYFDQSFLNFNTVFVKDLALKTVSYT